MSKRKRVARRAVILSLFASAAGAEPLPAEEDSHGWHYDFYGSLRMQAETVRPGNRDALSAYSGIRDAYSRLGVNAHYEWAGGTRLFGQIELPFDSANMRMHDPYDQGGVGRTDRDGRKDPARTRIARAGLEGALGTLSVGQQWMPYYNAISAPLDWFSTYYSGFATYTSFRVENTIAYYSPDLNGFGLAFSYSNDRGNRRSPARIDDRRIQGTVSYALDDFTVAAGVDDRGNADGYRDRIYGLSGTYTRGSWYFAAKYEVTDNNVPDSFYGDGSRAVNLLASYTAGRNTYKAMVARVKNYGDNIIHLGVDHQYNEALTLFAEYYREQETAAITSERGGLAEFDAAARGGQVLAVGLRYNF